MINPEVQLGTLKLVVLEVEKERVRLHNRIPQSRMERDSIGEERASNKAKIEVLHQLFGYDYIQSIIDSALKDS